MLKLKRKKKKEKRKDIFWVDGSLVGSLSPKDNVVGSVNVIRQMGHIGPKVYFDFNLPSH